MAATGREPKGLPVAPALVYKFIKVNEPAHKKRKPKEKKKRAKCKRKMAKKKSLSKAGSRKSNFFAMCVWVSKGFYSKFYCTFRADRAAVIMCN